MVLFCVYARSSALSIHPWFVATHQASHVASILVFVAVEKPTGQHHDITLAAGQYHIHIPQCGFDVHHSNRWATILVRS